MSPLRKSVCAALVIASCSLAAAPALAVRYDHLKCYKVKDSAPTSSATVDLRPLDNGTFELEAGCTVKVRSRQLCFPSTKEVLFSADALLNVEGQELENAFLCYKVKCPKTVLPDSLEMSDQFATRNLTGLRTTTLCAPAIPGAPPPTTTTTIPMGTPRSCVDATPPNCDGTCNNYNFACAEDAGACVCLYVDVFGGCPMFNGGPPECYGSCEGSQTCIEVGGACQCGFAFE